MSSDASPADGGVIPHSSHVFRPSSPLSPPLPFLPENSLGGSQLLVFPDALEARCLQGQPQLAAVANAAVSHIKAGLPSLRTSS